NDRTGRARSANNKIIGWLKLCREPALIGLNAGVEFGCSQFVGGIVARVRFPVCRLCELRCTHLGLPSWLLEAVDRVAVPDCSAAGRSASAQTPRDDAGVIALLQSEISWFVGWISANNWPWISHEGLR